MTSASKLSFVLFALTCASVVSGCGGPQPDDPILTLETQPLVMNQLDLGVGTFSNQLQTADIVDVTPSEFAVGFIGEAAGLKYAFLDSKTGQQAMSVQNGQAIWVRANSSKAWDIDGCSSNFFAAQTGTAAVVDQVRKCSGAWQPIARTTMATGGSAPSLASKGSGNFGSMLVVYGHGSQLVGRFWRFRSAEPGSGLSEEFLIAPVTGGVVNTDVIYNQHSDQFIVGFTEHSGTMGCWVRNATVSGAGESQSPPAFPPTVVPTAQAFALCDGGAGGHRTSSAYSPLGDGSYVWWRQDGSLNAKGVFLHDSLGRRLNTTSNPPLRTSNNQLREDDEGVGHYDDIGISGTVPVTSTPDPARPYVALKSGAYHDGSIDALYAFRGDKKWATLDNLGATALGNQLAVTGMPEAVRTLEKETVLLTATPDNHLHVAVQDFPFSPRIAATQNFQGEATAIFTGVNDAVFHAWPTSHADAQTWASSISIDGFRTAQQVKAMTDVNSRQEIIYIGYDNVLRHLREWTPGANTYQNLYSLTAAGAKARQLAVYMNFDGTLMVVYSRFPDNVLCFTKQTAPGSDTWTPEAMVADASTKARRIAIGGVPGGRVQVVFIAPDYRLKNVWQTAPNATTWVTPSPVGPFFETRYAREVQVHRWSGSDLLQVIYTKYSSENDPTDGALITSAQATFSGPSLGNWSAAHSIGATARQLAVHYNRGGHLHLVFAGLDDTLNQIVYPGSGPWPTSSPLLSPSVKAKRLAAMRDSGGDGRLEVFYVGLDDVAYRTSQTTNGETNFYAPQAL